MLTPLRLLRLGRQWPNVLAKTTCLVCACVTYCTDCAASGPIFHTATVLTFIAVELASATTRCCIANAFPSTCYFDRLWCTFNDSASACRVGWMWGIVNAPAGACHIALLDIVSAITSSCHFAQMKLRSDI